MPTTIVTGKRHNSPRRLCGDNQIHRKHGKYDEDGTRRKQKNSAAHNTYNTPILLLIRLNNNNNIKEETSCY